jgi:hypothetical protein
LIIVLAMAVSVIVTQFIRRRKDLFALRPIPAFSRLPVLVGESIESNRPLHLSLGSAGIGGASTLLTVVSAELFYQVAQRAAIGDISPVLTLSDASALPIGQDILRRAYQSRGLLDRFHYSSVRWYPNGNRSLAFAAALTGLMGDDQVASNVFAGSFGAELALLLEAATRRNLPTVAASDQLDGLAVAYALADDVLLGEEVFTAGAYLGGSPSQIAGVVTTDVLRWLLIGGIFALMILTLVKGQGG